MTNPDKDIEAMIKEFMRQGMTREQAESLANGAAAYHDDVQGLKPVDPQEFYKDLPTDQDEKDDQNG